MAKYSPDLIASGMFVEVSKELPASVAAQSLRIALTCRERQLDPMELGLALLSNEPQVAKLSKVAKTNHEEHGVEATPDSNDTGAIIGIDFAYAGIFLSLPTPTLKHLISRYDFHINLGEPRFQRLLSERLYRVEIFKEVEKIAANGSFEQLAARISLGKLTSDLDNMARGEPKSNRSYLRDILPLIASLAPDYTALFD